MSHTKEPWNPGFHTGMEFPFNICAPDGRVIATVKSEQDCRRIIACVNACAGVTTENLERNRIGELITKVERENDELKQQRDELLALSVTKIMLDVVPGDDGMGEEVYAKSVADVERAFAKLCDKIEAVEQQRDELLAAWKESNEALGLLSFHCDGVVGTANPPHEIYNKTYDIYRRHQAAIAKVKL